MGRHSLGVRLEPLAGQIRVEHHHPAAGEERPVRHRPVGRPATLCRVGARCRFRLSPRRQAALQQTSSLRQGSVETSAGRGDSGLREHDPLASDAHQPAPLRRLHRLSGQSARNVPAGARRSAAIRSAHRKHESGLQGQEEAHVPRQGAFRINPPPPPSTLPLSIYLSLCFFALRYDEPSDNFFQFFFFLLLLLSLFFPPPSTIYTHAEKEKKKCDLLIRHDRKQQKPQFFFFYKCIIVIKL